MRWASALSERKDPSDALAEALEALARGLAGTEPELLFLFVSPHHQRAFRELPPACLRRFPKARLVGCTGGGIIGDAREVERKAALSLTAAALPGVTVTPFRLGTREDSFPTRSVQGLVPLPTPPAPPAKPQPGNGVHPAENAATPATATTSATSDDGSDTSFVLLPDPQTCDSGRVLLELDAAYPGAPKVGGLASGAGRERETTALFLDDAVLHEGGVGVALSGDLVMDTLVAQGCRPIGTPLLITSAKGNLILELSGQPALDVLRGLFAELSTADQQLFRQTLSVGIEMRPDQIEYQHGDFLIRNVLGLVPEQKAIAIGAPLKLYQAIQFHLRDAEASAEDLRRHLRLYRARGHVPAGALLFSCLGRGEGLYGRPDSDSTEVITQLGRIPLGGFFCAGEIGPVGGTTYIHGYTSSFGLFRSRSS